MVSEKWARINKYDGDGLLDIRGMMEVVRW